MTLGEEGYVTHNDQQNWKHEDIHTLLTSMSGRPETREVMCYDNKHIKDEQALT